MTTMNAVHDPITGGERGTAWLLVAVAAAANAAGYFLNWFGQIPWWDDVVHGYTIFALTLLLALHLTGTVLAGAADHAVLFVLTAAAVGLALGALWEVAEWAYDQWMARGNVILGKRDTILDLVWDSIGALLAGIVALAMARD